MHESITRVWTDLPMQFSSKWRRTRVSCGCRHHQYSHEQERKSIINIAFRCLWLENLFAHELLIATVNVCWGSNFDCSDKKKVREIYIPKLICVAASMEAISLALKTPIKFHSWELSSNRFQSRINRDAAVLGTDEEMTSCLADGVEEIGTLDRLNKYWNDFRTTATGVTLLPWPCNESKMGSPGALKRSKDLKNELGLNGIPADSRAL